MSDKEISSKPDIVSEQFLVHKDIVEGSNIVFSYDNICSSDGDVLLALNRKSTNNQCCISLNSAWKMGVQMCLDKNSNFTLQITNDRKNWLKAFTVDAITATFCIEKELIIGSAIPRGGGVTIAKPNPSIYLHDTTGSENTQRGVVSWVDINGVEQAWCGFGSGANSAFSILTKSTDGLQFVTYGGAYNIDFIQNSKVRLRISENGNIGVCENNPTVPLHINGAARVGSFSVSELPSAAGSGAGAIIFVSDESGGATLAFSDGSNWLRIQDRAIVS